MRRTLVVLCLALVLTVVSVGAAATAKTTRVNRNSAGAVSLTSALYPGISGSGRYVVFETGATNMVPHDTNSETDVFVRDRATGKTKRVSVRSSGGQANGSSGYAAISANGRFVVFTSGATNLVPGDTNATDDVFLHDRKTHKTWRISIRANGIQANANSDNGAVSANGRFVVFVSNATNLAPGDTNGVTDLFVRDRKLKTTRRVSVSSTGAQANAGTNGGVAGAISDDGRYVVFETGATNLVPNDTNGMRDVFVRDRKLHVTRRVSVGPGNTQSNATSRLPTISGNGRVVVFGSDATNLVAGDTNADGDIFTRDLKTHRTRRVSLGPGAVQADNFSSDPFISTSGRWVAFSSSAENLVSGDTNSEFDVFVRDRRAGKTRRVSVSSSGAEGDNGGNYGLISADGRFVIFQSNSTNLIANDTNGFDDIFVRGPLH